MDETSEFIKKVREGAPATKVCAVCKEKKSTSAFKVSYIYEDHLAPYCEACGLWKYRLMMGNKRMLS